MGKIGLVVQRLAVPMLAGLVFAGTTTHGVAQDAFSRQALLRSIGQKVVIPTYNAFNLRASRLQGAVGAYCNAVKANPTTASPVAARNAWRAAMSQWQIAEMFQFGPVAMSSGLIRNNIYSWPLENTCSVDQNVINFESNLNPEGAPFNITQTTVDSRGLGAIAYLLYARTKAHTCPAAVTVTNSWNARPIASRETARCEYATAAARNTTANAQALVNAWSPVQGNYLNQLVTSGSPGGAFASLQEAINVVTDAMFYFEEEVKEMKLSEPLGIFENNCGMGVICPEQVESLDDRTNNGRLEALIYNSGYAKQMLRANFVAFQKGFHGGNPADPTAVGFDDFLAALGERQFANGMGAQIRALIASVNNINGTLNAALVNDFTDVQNTYLRLQPVSITLRNQFLSILGLEAPATSASDSD
ncbi:MAG: imelysin family protein [Gammaproteobacteria bacterium]|nr:imelysin family protein [Gammaproteobacteria bacterium]